MQRSTRLMSVNISLSKGCDVFRRPRTSAHTERAHNVIHTYNISNRLLYDHDNALSLISTRYRTKTVYQTHAPTQRATAHNVNRRHRSWDLRIRATQLNHTRHIIVYEPRPSMANATSVGTYSNKRRPLWHESNATTSPS